MKMNLEQEILQNRYDILALQAMVNFLSCETIPSKLSKYWDLSRQYARSKLQDQFPKTTFTDLSDPDAALEALKKLAK
jgi:hypothetical protein